MRISLLLTMLFSTALVAQTSPPHTSKTSEGYRIAGIVYDAASGQTLPGARVSLGSTAGGKTPDRSVLTGPDGAFAFEHLPADKYQMYGEAVGYPQQGFEQHEAPYLTGVVIGPNISSDHLVFKLQRGSVISGTVTDEFNEPVRNAQVMLFRRGLSNGRFTTQIAERVMSDDQGSYKAASLLPGTYFVAVSARPWYAQPALETRDDQQQMASPQLLDSMKRLDVAFPLTFYSGTTESSGATEIKLRTGDRFTADVVLHSVTAAQVRVKMPPPSQPSATPQHYRFPSIQLVQQAFDQEIPVPSEQRGYATDMLFTSTAPGHYLVHVRVPGEEDRVQELEVNGETVLDPEAVTAPGSGSIKGLVRMMDGQPVPQDTVILLRKHNQPTGATRVHDDGTFSFGELQPGSYEIGVANVREIYLAEMAATNSKVTGRSVAISGTAEVNLALVIGRGVGEIKGVATKEGKGVGGTMVLLVPADPESSYGLFRRDQSDSDGTFTLSQIVPGKYSLIAIEDGWDLEWSKPAVLKPFLAKAEKLEVAPGGKYDTKVVVQKP